MTERTIEHIEVEGARYSVIPIVKFEDWLNTRYGGMEKFRALSRKDKDAIFLRWKWGFEDARANEGTEINERSILRLFKDDDLSNVSKLLQFHIGNKRKFDSICEDARDRIGLSYKQDPLVDDISKKFNAKEY